MSRSKNCLRSKLFSNQAGIGLVEVIAALGISVVVITSLVSLTIFTLRSSQRNKVLLESSKQANKSLELLRAFRDSSEWGDTAGFLETLSTAQCDVVACKITGITLGSITEYPVIADPYSLQPLEVDTYFSAVDGYTFGDLDPATTEVVRISVFSTTRVGNQVKTNTLSTDLSNWRGL
jgi:hypothetical protein